MYAMSFLTLGIFWVGQQTQLNHLERADRDLAWLHIWYLAAVALMPFSTRLLAEFIEFRTALLVYLQHSSSGSHPLLHLVVRQTCSAHPRWHRRAYRDRHRSTDHHRTVLIRARRGAVLHQHLLQHRIHFSRAAELCARAAFSACRARVAGRKKRKDSRCGTGPHALTGRRTRRRNQLACAMRKLRSRCDRSLMGTLGVRQIDCAYSRMVRSEEKLPERAVFKMDIAVQLCPSL